jgi:HEAT repeat protein
MRASHVALVVGAAGVLGTGLWLGRSTSTSSAAPPAAPTAIAEPRPPPVRAARPAPLLAPPRAAARALAADLRDPDPKIRRAAMREAAADRDVDVKLLLDAAHDRDQSVAAAATDALAHRYADGAVSVHDMIARATDHAIDERVRLNVLDAVGLVPDADAAAMLVKLLQSGDTFERRSAAILLQHQDADVAIPALAQALADADEVVRGNAHESLVARSRGRDFGMDANAWRGWWQSRAR